MKRTYASVLNIRVVLSVLVVLMAVMLGFLLELNLLTIKMLILLMLLALAAVALRFAGVVGVLYAYSLIWWLPVDLQRFLPPDLFGKFASNMTLPELVVYGGILLGLSLEFLAPSKRRNVSSEPDFALYVFLILILVGGVIASGGIVTLAGFAMFRRSTLFFAATVLACKYLLKSEREILRLLHMLLWAGCAFAAFALIAAIVPNPYFAKAASYLHTTRLGGMYIIPKLGTFYFGPNNIGLIAAMLMIMAFVFMLKEEGLAKRALMGAAFILNAGVMFLTGSRGAWGSAAAGILLVSLCLVLFQKRADTLLFLSMLVVIGMMLLPKVLNIELLNRLQSLASPSLARSDSIQTRLGLFKYGLDMFMHSPFGIGYGTFVTRTDGVVLWEQNLLLNTALGGGFLGLIGLSGFFVTLFYRGITRVIVLDKQATWFILASLGPSFVFFIDALASDPNSETSIYISWLVLGIAYTSLSLTNYGNLRGARLSSRPDPVMPATNAQIRQAEDANA